MTGIVYSHFERWYKRDRVANVVPVTIVDRDSLSVSPVDTIASEDLPSAGGDALIQRFEILDADAVERRNLLDQIHACFSSINEGNKDYESLLLRKLALHTF